MKPLTFACPECTKKMAVGHNLAGSKVRCPHCRAVVVAPGVAPVPQPIPAAAPPVPAPVAITVPRSSPSGNWNPPPNSPSLPGLMPEGDSGNLTGALDPVGSGRHGSSGDSDVFQANGHPNGPKRVNREPVESIFGDPLEPMEAPLPSRANPSYMPSTDRIKGVNLPPVPPQVIQVVPPQPSYSPPPPAAYSPPPYPTPQPQYAPQYPTPQPHYPTPQQQYAAPPPAANPWASVNVDPEMPTTEMTPPKAVAAPPAVASVRQSPPADPEITPTPTRRRWLVPVLAVYAVLATAVAIWGVLRGGDAGHPLSNIPDLFGEYDKADRKRVSHLPKPDDPLPPELKVALGSTRRIGDLEIEPLGVEEMKLTRVTTYDRGKEATQPLANPTLVLRVKLTNHSNVTFYPVDPAFQRKAQFTEPAVAGVYVGDKERYLGSPVPWPFAKGVKRVYVTGQEGDDRPLKPGESHEYLIAAADDARLTKAVQSAAGPVMWKLHLRRGTTRYRFTDVSVSTLVGVEFAPDQVKWM